jgi:phosphohistidine phosphatase
MARGEFEFSAYHCFMKELMIVRHAKSSWDDDTLSDFERPLNERGRTEALDMAIKWSNSPWRPDLLVCSTAVRAQETLQFFQYHLDPNRNTEVRLELDIYDATLATLLDILNSLPSQVDRVMIFGHNPGFSKLLAFLTGEYYELPTCATALVQLEIEDWLYIYENCGSIKEYQYPRKVEL